MLDDTKSDRENKNSLYYFFSQ